MEFLESYKSQSGQDIEIYGGVIRPEQMRHSDELHLQIGKYLLRGVVVAEGEKPDVELHLESGERTYLGKHTVTNPEIDGRWGNRPGQIIKDGKVHEIQFEGYSREVEDFTPRRKPFSMGVEFEERLREQAIDPLKVPVTDLSTNRVRKGFPLVMRRK